MIEFQYLPSVDNTLADALSGQDWQTREEPRQRSSPKEKNEEDVTTGATVVPQSGLGVCGGPASPK